jgi:hypothetical protein
LVFAQERLGYRPHLLDYVFSLQWLSNRDFLAYLDAALFTPAVDIIERSKSEPSENSTDNCVVLNAMSRNSGSRWCLSRTEAVLGVVAVDDSRKN